jgi:hypothetical protein
MTGPAWADPDDVRAWASSLDEAKLLCRDLGHLWKPYRANFNLTERAYERVLRCSRCKTERSQTLSQVGSVLRNAYDYQPGYLTPRLGRLAGSSRDVIRLESISRAIEASGGTVPKLSVVRGRKRA